MNPNFVLNLDDSQYYQNFQSYETSQFFANPNQFPITENVQTSQNTGKHPRDDKWNADEDISLMLAYYIVNQKKTSIWAQMKELYDANQTKSPGKIGNRNIAQMKVGDEESGGSTKRSRSTEEGEYCVQSNTKGANITRSTTKCLTGRDAAKRKEKSKSSNEVVAELRAMRLSRDSEVEVMKKRLDLDQQREQKQIKWS
ncbi:unnamed protein product [Lactuca saligna]|uniref:No apical meristem-associated C-terminal domain-containing protein n=1 Tax=Lactuca saligna TaxID=75948 RepID=A0AA35V1G7_LACSI|nr:unnamed protein product [Lactuca saligna]